MLKISWYKQTIFSRNIVKQMTICYDRLLTIRYEVKIWILWFGIILVFIYQVLWLHGIKTSYIYIWFVARLIYNYIHIYFLCQMYTTKPFVSLDVVFCGMVLLSNFFTSRMRAKKLFENSYVLLENVEKQLKYHDDELYFLHFCIASN